MRLAHKVQSLAALAAIALLVGCEGGGGGGGGGGGPTEPPTPVPTTISVSPSSASVASLGATQQFNATVQDQTGATMSGLPISWSSSDGSVASVSASGLATAVNNGSTNITATLLTLSSSASLDVQQSVSQLSLTADSVLFVSLGDAQTIGVEILDALGSVVTSEATLALDSTVWSSTDTQVITVDQSGSVTAVGPGQAEVIAQWGTIQSTLTATVSQEATSLSVSPTTLSFSATGDTARLVVSATDAGGSAIDQPTVTWTSSDDAVVSVVDGLVTSVANGTAMITASSGSASAEAEAMVLLLAELPIVIVVGEKGISAEAAADTVAVGGTTQMSASVTDEEGNPLSVTVRWATSNPAIATVDETGLVTGVYAGSAEIVATYAGVSGVRTITVTQN